MKVDMEKKYSYYKEKNKIITILILGYYFFSIAHIYLSWLNQSLGWYLGLLCACFAAILSVESSGQRVKREEILFYGIILILLFLSLIHNNNVPITTPIQYIRHFLIAFSLIRTKLWEKATKLSLFIFICYFLCCLLSGMDAHAVINGVSQNVISIHLILFSILYIMSMDNLESNSLYILQLLSLFIIFWTGCRSGIVSGGILLGVSVFVFYHESMQKKKISIILLIIFLICISVYLYTNMDEGTFMYYLDMKAEEGIVHNRRFIFIQEFYEKILLNGKNFLFGPPLNSITSTAYTDYNIHISYLQAYAVFGVVFFFGICYLIGSSLLKYARKRHIYFILLMSLTFRSLTDVSAFIGEYDSLFYYFIFEYFLFYKYNKIVNFPQMKAKIKDKIKIGKN